MFQARLDCPGGADLADCENYQKSVGKRFWQAVKVCTREWANSQIFFSKGVDAFGKPACKPRVSFHVFLVAPASPAYSTCLTVLIEVGTVIMLLFCQLLPLLLVRGTV